MVRLTAPASQAQWHVARGLIEEYAAALKVDLCFQNFAHELEHLAEEYAPPTGALLLAQDGGGYLGCVGLRQLSTDIGEIKRLYTIPAARGQGVGRALAAAIIAAARERGYQRLVLDTLPAMKEAQSLYVSLGFRQTTAYRFNPVPGSLYLELPLR